VAIAVVLSVLFLASPLAGYLIVSSSLPLGRKLLVGAALGYAVIAIPFLVVVVAHLG
jgi:hypothetical protein